MQDGAFPKEDLWHYLADADFPGLGNCPATWRDSVLAPKDEMANHVVIRSAASLFSLNIHIVDWRGVSILTHTFSPHI